MNEEIDLVKLEQATFRTANQDGLTELWMGLMLMTMALVLVQTAFVATVAFVIIFQAAINERIKEKYTYPRIGKVKLRDEDKLPSGYGWILVVLTVVPAFAAVVFSPRIENELLFLIATWAPFILGVGLLQPSKYLVERSALKRYYGLGAIALILGAVIVFIDFTTPLDRMILYIFLVSISFVLMGIGSLIRFVMKYPILATEELSDESSK